jgi:hypothetical protein
MKNSLIIVKSNPTYVLLLYYLKIIHLLNFFFFKRMVIEMLLNSDIQKIIVQMILHFQNEINVIMLLNLFFKVNSNHFILDKISIKHEFSKFMFL